MIQRRVVGYLRVSSREQLKGQGLQEQENAIELRAKQELGLRSGDRIPKEQYQLYIEKPSSAFKGTANARPQLQAALNDVCESNGILIVRNLNRLARSPEDCQKILQHLKVHGCDIVAIGEEFIGLFCGKEQALRMAANVAEAESSNLQFQAKRAAAAHKSSGKHWGRPPYGYIRNDTGQLKQHPTQFSVLLEIIHRRNAGESTSGIARVLNDRKIQTQKGKRWEAKQIQNACKMFAKHGLRE